jgi:O-antigen/teichoic acid export membrane protein
VRHYLHSLAPYLLLERWGHTAISTLGIPSALTKFTAEYSEKDRAEIAQKIAGKLLLGTIAIGILAALILCGLSVLHWLPTNTKNIYLYLIALALPFNIIATSLVGLFKGNRQYVAVMWGNIIASPITFVVVLIVLHYKPVLSGLVVYYVLTAIILLASYAAVTHGRIKVSFGKIPKQIWQPVLKYIAVVSGIILLDQIVWDRSEVLFLGHYSPPQQVAFYTLSYTMTNGVMALFPGSILGVLLPHISAFQGVNNVKSIASSYKTASRYMGLIVAMLVGGGIALATPFIFALYGQHYAHMVPVFRILIFTQGWAAIGGITAVVLYGTTRQSIILKTGLILSIINIATDFLIIPHYGAVGAAISNGLAQFSGVIVGVYILTKRGIPFPIYDYIKITGITFLSGGTTFLLTRWLGYSNIWSLIIGGTFFLILFCCLTLYSKLVQPREIPILNKLVTGKD